MAAAPFGAVPLGQGEEYPLRLQRVVVGGLRHSHSMACQ